MCDPTLATVGLNAVGTMAGISSQNRAAAANARNAKSAANDQYVQNSRSYIDESRSILQSGMDMVLQGREAESRAYTSAIQSGVTGTSVRALMRDKGLAATRNRQRNQQDLAGLKTSTETRNKQSRATARARIAQMPSTSFGIGDAASILAPIPKYGSKTLSLNGLGD